MIRRRGTSFAFSLLLAGAAVVSLPVFIPQEAAAQPAGVHDFVPDGPWLVGQTALAEARGLDDINLPCALSGLYNNGFVVRFSGGGGSFLAMAVDFRQSAFHQGVTYDAVLSVDNTFMQKIEGTAFTDSILIFNLRFIPGAYQALVRGQSMGLQIGGNAMRFRLAGFSHGVKELESCYAAKDAGMPPLPPLSPLPVGMPAAAPQAVGPGAIPYPMQASPVPMAAMPGYAPAYGAAGPQEVYVRRQGVPGTDAVFGASPYGMADVAAGVGPVPPSPPPFDTDMPPMPGAPGSDSRQAVPLHPAGVWQARAGDDIQTVLQRWGQQAGVDVVWDAPYNGRVAQDFSMEGSLEQAVNLLLTLDSSLSGTQAELQNLPMAVPPSNPEPFAPVNGGSVPRPPEEAFGEGVPEMLVSEMANGIPEPAPAAEPLSASSARGGPVPLVPPSAVSAGGTEMPLAQAVSVPPVPEAVALPAPQRWAAPEGAYLGQVLRDWARMADVELVWNANRDFRLKRNIDLNASFAEAVAEALAQYRGDSVRPVGQLNTDPQSGDVALFVQVNRSL